MVANSKWNPFNKIIGRKKDQVKDQVNERLSSKAYTKFLEVMTMAEETLSLKEVSDVDEEQFVQKSNENSVVQEVRNLNSRFGNLIERAKLIVELRKSYPDKYNEKSIEVLQEKFYNCSNAIKALNNGLKNIRLSRMQRTINNSILGLENKQTTLRVDIIELRKENRNLFFKRDISQQDRERIREVNKSTIEKKEKQIESIKVEIEKLGTKEGMRKRIGELKQKFEIDIKTNINKFKYEIAKLDFAVRSIEKGKAPAPPVQTNMVEQPSRTTPLSPKDCIQYLDTFTGYVEQAGVYEGSKEYFNKVIDYAKGSNTVGNDDSNKMQGSLSKPDMTKQDFIHMINTVKDAIGNKLAKENMAKGNIVGRYTANLMENKTNNVEKAR